MLQQNLIIIFTRFPDPGTTKTRLIPALGSEGAADLHRRMAEHIIQQCASYVQQHDFSLQIHHEGGSKHIMEQWLGPHEFITQPGGDLGIRLTTAFQTAFSIGFRKIVIIGTDCPDLTPGILQQAFQSLDFADLVLGPAHDGGYYLIGLKKSNPLLFKNISWGTSVVLNQTLDLARKHKMIISQLEQLNDIDRPEDLAHFSYHSNT